jgi:fructosamine-3-kinase
MDSLASQIISKVIPRLLRPLESHGNKIKPVLLHGDLWHGNVSVDNESGKPVLYDAGCFFGHNEYDAGPWRASRYQFNRTHLRAYHELVPVSEPAEDHDDRNALYAMCNDLLVSSCWRENKGIREL